MNLQKIKNLVHRLDRVGEELGDIEASLAEELSDTEEEEDGFALSDLLMMPDPLRQTLLEIQRMDRISAVQLAEVLGLDAETVEAQLQILTQQGHVAQAQDADRMVYRALVKARRPARLPADIWGALEQRIEQSTNQAYA